MGNPEALESGLSEDDARLAAERNRTDRDTHGTRNRREGARITGQDNAETYDMSTEGALNLERHAGPTGCLPCSSWNHLCGMGFRMSGYIPVYEKIQVPINLAEINRNWLSLTISGLSQIGGRLSRSVCPYVRVHVVNIHSGDYILSVPVLPASSVISGNENESKEGHPIAPLNTSPCHLRSFDADVRWDETFLIDAQYSAVTGPNAVLLFEILDNPPSIRKSHDRAGHGSERGNKKGKFSTCLAWGYLLPRGTRSGRLNFAMPLTKSSMQNMEISDLGSKLRYGAKSSMNHSEIKSDESVSLLSDTHVDNKDVSDDSNPPFLPIRLQLYEYRDESWLIEGIQRRNMKWQPKPEYGHLKTPTNLEAHNLTLAMTGQHIVPEVYLQWRRQKHVKASGILSIIMSYQSRGLSALKQVVAQDGGVDVGIPSRPGDAEDKQSLVKEEAERTSMRAAVSRRSRSDAEPTIIPNRVLHRCHSSGKDGSVASRYSHSGVLLAIASKGTKAATAHVAPRGGGFSRYPGCLYALSILDSDTGDKLWEDELAHFGVVYDIKWSANDETLACCSSDGRVRIYAVRVLSRGFRDHKEGMLDNIQSRRGDSRRFSVPKSPGPGGSILGGIAATISVSSGQILETFPPVFIYSLVIVEPLGPTGGALRLLTGGSDGRIKVCFYALVRRAIRI